MNVQKKNQFPTSICGQEEKGEKPVTILQTVQHVYKKTGETLILQRFSYPLISAADRNRTGTGV